MSGEVKSVDAAHVKCEHCHGEGHVDCPTCHGKGRTECAKCHGDGKLACSKCKGKGRFSNCKQCNSTGKTTCSKCGGSGKMREKCAGCSGTGKVVRERLVNCSKCHGTGVHSYTSSGKPMGCIRCHGTGQKTEKYTITCPTCGGTGRSQYEVTCSRCKGSKVETCSRCKGTGHAICGDCEGSGKVGCDNCEGAGSFICNDCSGAGNHVCVECFGTGDAMAPGVPQNAVGNVCEAGDALKKKKDYVHAFLKYREAAETEHSTGSLWRLGRMYEKGQAVQKSIKKANILYRASANAGNRFALCLLGKNYLNGDGVETNKSEARRLLELSVAKGYEEAKEFYKQVETEKLSKETPSGVVGWRGKFEIPKFVLDADPATDQAAKIAKPVKDKKRWAFVTIGLLLGWMGAHFIYAKRWGLFALHIIFMIATIAFAPCAILYLSSWIGGIVFVKKDGSGTRMS